ncbi:TIGR03086 family metal-binding protein [Actinomycetospora lutea]|uniref:TIGR03086 family metal-binding protein n=1 Tax=Actinomycetospora lutea TaxID=663604 RepID=UPI002365F0B5|nr:TIGR03086 family metal-binding protein [Actinomycetospora lutea]MDD7940598.1 TIGR03086 family metal-binding protein [Actinomycetospora lutea]
MFPDFTPRPHLVVAAAAPHEKLVAAAAERLDAPVPCEDWTVRHLVEHMMTWTPVLAGSGRGAPPAARTPRAEGNWVATLDAGREDLVAVWSEPSAWTGTTTMTASELPASMVGTMVLCELVLHAWDLAKGLGEPVGWDDAVLGEVLEAMQQMAPQGRGSAFGDEVPVPDDAELLDRIVAVAGRDPSWRP